MTDTPWSPASADVEAASDAMILLNARTPGHPLTSYERAKIVAQTLHDARGWRDAAESASTLEAVHAANRERAKLQDAYNKIHPLWIAADSEHTRLSASVEALTSDRDAARAELEAMRKRNADLIAERDLANARAGGEGWISVKERMPSEDGNHNSRRVLACVWYDENPQPQRWLCWTHRGEWWHDDGRELLRCGLRVSHWMELPPPPASGTGEKL